MPLAGSTAVSVPAQGFEQVRLTAHANLKSDRRASDTGFRENQNFSQPPAAGGARRTILSTTLEHCKTGSVL